VEVIVPSLSHLKREKTALRTSWLNNGRNGQAQFDLGSEETDSYDRRALHKKTRVEDPATE